MCQGQGWTVNQKHLEIKGQGGPGDICITFINTF